MTNQKYCAGCYCDVYNHGCGGAKQCWMLAKAKVVKRKMVHINDVPPWKHKPITTLDCYHRPQFVMVDANRTN